MRRLFLKIFLWYWVTAVVVGAAMAVTWSLQPEIVVSRWRAMMGEATALYAQASAEEIDRYGQNGIESYLDRLNSSTNIHASVFDDNGRVISGRPSATARELALNAARSNQSEFIIRPAFAYSARRASGPSGRFYIFVAELPRGPIASFGPTLRAQATRWTVAIVVSGFICYLLTLYLTSPILRMRTASRQLAAGELSARASGAIEHRRDEIGQLVRDFNRMADRIESLVASQKQLISDMSHELRSPLARLTVALGLARQRAGDEATGALDRIERETERLNDMIGKLLTLARLGSADEPPEKIEVNLTELLQEIVDDAGFEAQERNCTVVLSTEEEDCTVQGSPELLHSALENIVRNAVRYTESGTQIDVSLVCPPRNQFGPAQIAIRDHGPGVPEAELPNLFRPFYRLTTARERSSGGVGLGLAIADRAIRIHGGRIIAHNAPDGGLLVEVRLPATPVNAAAAGKLV